MSKYNVEIKEQAQQMLEEFMQTRPLNVDISENDIMDEVRAVRYAS